MRIKKYILAILLTVFLCNIAHADEIVFDSFASSEDFGISDSLEDALRDYTGNNFFSELPVFSQLQFGPSETMFSATSANVDAIDPSSAGYYPGGRGPNKLVIYTPQYGFHTGTNEYGTEAIVDGNVVTALSGADSSIPQNGVVISGHGRAKNWISQNISVGSKIYIDRENNTITAYTTSASYIYGAKSKISEAQAIIDYYKLVQPGYNPSSALSHIQIANNYLKIAQNSMSNSIILKQYSKEAIEEANMAIKAAMPYIKEELKGVWIRPTEYTENQIIATLDDIKANGFNNVFLETYYHGRTIFPSKTMNKYGFMVQNENFKGINPLEIWIREAHKRGIKVHTWFQSFYVGNEPPEYNPFAILSVHPDWGNKTKQDASNYGATKSLSEHNGYFLDPANPCVQDFLEELITEIITDYHPDGINLDYIRYPNSNPKSDSGSWGYTTYARYAFEAKYGIDPVDLSSSDALWYDWNTYRRNNITEFVKRVGAIGRKNDVYISAVIFPDIASALSTKQQDWRKWSYYDYIDGFTPIFLTYDSSMLSSMMKDVLSTKYPQTDLYAGLFVTFMGGASEDLIKQIFETRKMGVNGVILFDYAHTTPVYTSSLMVGAFNPKVIESSPKVAQKAKKKQEVSSQKQLATTEVKQEDKSKKKTIVTTNSKGMWIFSK